MKKLLKYLIILITVFLSVTAVAFVGVRYFLNNNWKRYYSNQDLNEITNAINSAQDSPKNLVRAYELVYNSKVDLSISTAELWWTWSLLTLDKQGIQNSSLCPCLKAAEKFENKFPLNYHSLSWLFLAHAIEIKSNPEKCFDFVFLNNLKGYSTKQFDKPWNQLTSTEFITLLEFSKNPTFYSKNPDLLIEKVQSIKKSI